MQATHVSDPATCRRGLRDPEVRDFMIKHNKTGNKKTPAGKLGEMVLKQFPNAYKDEVSATQGVYNFRSKLKKGDYNTLLKQGKGTGQSELTIANKPTIKPKHTQKVTREVPITINGMTISVPGNKVTVNGHTIEW